LASKLGTYRITDGRELSCHGVCFAIEVTRSVQHYPLPVTATATAASPQLAIMGMVPGLHQAIAARHERPLPPPPS
jgi:hypothetical protein